MDNAWRKLSWPAFVTAVQFLTRVPLPGGMNRPGADPALLGHCPLFFPLVGGLVGAAAGGVLWAAAHVWPPPVAIVLALIAEALLTGAFHEDAVADACDAFGGGWTRDDVLRILKDSRVGSYGALGLGLAVALRGATLGAFTALASRRRLGVRGLRRPLGHPGRDGATAADPRARGAGQGHRPAHDR